jgi:serine/threonine-protein kinase
VVCFELLTGRPPFTGESATAVLVAHVLQEAPRLSQLRPGLPAELDAPLLRMLAKAPEARPSTAGEALAELEAAAKSAGIEVSAGPPVLPRPQRAAAGRESDATVARVARSGTRASLASRTLVGHPTRWLWLGLAPVALLAWYLSGPALEERAVAPEPPSAPPPPAAAPVTPPAAPPPPAAEPSVSKSPNRVPIRVRGAPPGAELWLDDQKLGTAPGPVLVPFGDQPRQLSVRVPGQPARTLSVTPNAEQELTLPPEKPGRRRSSLPRDLENPF